MKFFLAPMQGLTGYTVRNAFHHHFDYIDKYYTPFIPAAKRMNAKIKRDIDPVNNDGITLIPQAMSIVETRSSTCTGSLFLTDMMR